MSITRARQVVQSSRNSILSQIDALARQAGVDRLTMARALQEGFNSELGRQDVEEDVEDGPRLANIEVCGYLNVVVSSQEELDNEVERVTNAATRFGITSLDVIVDSYDLLDDA